jgi:beta-glucosidase
MKLGISYPDEKKAGISEAVEAAKGADVAVVVVGDSPQQNSETHDRADLNLTGDQEELVKAVYATGTPTVVVLVNGRPLTINWIAAKIPAILEAWNPGQEGGTAVAEVLFGDYNPGGKLPITFSRSVGQLPVYYNYEPGWHTNTYVDGTQGTPLFQFGYGLSYTTFEYSNLRLSSPKIKADGKAAVSVDVQNTGDRAGNEVVQLYIHDNIASVVRPVKEMKRFSRINLKPDK